MIELGILTRYFGLSYVQLQDKTTEEVIVLFQKPEPGHVHLVVWGKSDVKYVVFILLVLKCLNISLFI